MKIFSFFAGKNANFTKSSLFLIEDITIIIFRLVGVIPKLSEELYVKQIEEGIGLL